MAATTPQPIRLEDYRPPDWLIDEVELDFRLGEAGTEVAARLALRRNPAAGDGPRPLVLDGQELELLGLAVDGEALGANRYTVDDEHLTIDGPAGRLHARDPGADPSRAQHRARGPVRLERHLLHPVRARGLPQDHLLPDRPDVMARYRVRIEAERERYPVLLANGNRDRGGRARGRPPFRGLGGPVPQAHLPVRAGRRPARQARGPASPPAPAARSRSRSIPSRRRSTNATTRWPRSRSRCGGTRTASASSTISTCS